MNRSFLNLSSEAFRLRTQLLGMQALINRLQHENMSFDESQQVYGEIGRLLECASQLNSDIFYSDLLSDFYVE